jgi:hypothetical protein
MTLVTITTPAPTPQIKAAMVDSAHQSMARLKAELAEVTGDAEDARAAADQAERRLMKVGGVALGGGGCAVFVCCVMSSSCPAYYEV